MCMCVFKCMRVYCIHVVIVEASRGRWIPRDGAYRWLWATLCECWEPISDPLEGCQVFLTTELFSSLFEKSFKEDWKK